MLQKSATENSDFQRSWLPSHLLTNLSTVSLSRSMPPVFRGQRAKHLREVSDCATRNRKHCSAMPVQIKISEDFFYTWNNWNNRGISSWITLFIKPSESSAFTGEGGRAFHFMDLLKFSPVGVCLFHRHYRHFWMSSLWRSVLHA